MSNPENTSKRIRLEMRLSEFDKKDIDELTSFSHELGLISRPDKSKFIIFLIREFKKRYAG